MADTEGVLGPLPQWPPRGSAGSTSVVQDWPRKDRVPSGIPPPKAKINTEYYSLNIGINRDNKNKNSNSHANSDSRPSGFGSRVRSASQPVEGVLAQGLNGSGGSQDIPPPGRYDHVHSGGFRVPSLPSPTSGIDHPRHGRDGLPPRIITEEVGNKGGRNGHSSPSAEDERRYEPADRQRDTDGYGYYDRGADRYYDDRRGEPKKGRDYSCSRGRSRYRRSPSGSSSSSDRTSSDRSGYGGHLTGGTRYRPAKRMTGTTRGCLACGGNGCGKNRLTMKEFDTAEQLAIKLKPQQGFQGEQDRRSGTTWLEEMEKKTEGHPEVIKYLWLKHHSEPRVWDRVTNKQVCPSHCYESYAYCLRIIKGRYRQKYDTDEHLQKAESQFNNCTQGRDTVPEFIDRLEFLANELCHLGAAPLEYTLKWRLFTGLSDDKVRDTVDNYVAKSSYSYERFRNKVLSQAQRREQLGKVFYSDGRNHNNNSSSRRESSDFRRDSYKNVGYKEKYGRRNDNDRYRSGSRNRDRDFDRRSSSFHSLSRESEMSDNGYQSRYLMAIGKDLVGIKCYRCMGKGHSARRCKAPEPANLDRRCKRCGNPNHTIDNCKTELNNAVCNRCNITGHLAYTCRSRPLDSGREGSITRRPSTPTAKINGDKASGSSRVNMVSNIRDYISDSKGDPRLKDPSVPMVIGEVRLQGKPTTALFDTGAEVSLITCSWLKEFAPRVRFEDDMIPRITTADGNGMEILGTSQWEV